MGWNCGVTDQTIVMIVNAKQRYIIFDNDNDNDDNNNDNDNNDNKDIYKNNNDDNDGNIYIY